MGYVLPVRHYQYEVYQRRAMKDKQTPFQIGKVAKIPRKMHRRNDGRYANAVATSRKSYVKRVPDAKLYAQLTGKGQGFSGSG